MRRLRQTRIKTYYHRSRETTKDAEGVTATTYGDPSAFKAYMWPATSKRQIEQYGDRIDNIANMRVEGPYTISVEKKTPVVNFANKTWRLGDGIHVHTPQDKEPDYKIVSFTEYKPLLMEIERV